MDRPACGRCEHNETVAVLLLLAVFVYAFVNTTGASSDGVCRAMGVTGVNHGAVHGWLAELRVEYN